MIRQKSKNKLWIFVLCLFFPWYSDAGAPPVVFVQLSDNILPCMLTVMKQARYLNRDSDIYLLTDGSAYRAFSKNYSHRLAEEGIHLINMEEIPVTQEHATFRQINQIDLSLFNGFWSFALERFFYLFDFMAYQNLENVVHLESDAMLYVDAEELLPLFEQGNTQIAAPFQSTVGCIPCLVFIKNTQSFLPLLTHILSEMKAYRGPRPHIDVNDMQTLASFYRTWGASYMTPLPTLMPEYEHYYSKRTSNFEPDNSTTLAFLSMNASLFPGYLFDAAALGVFANGNDRRYFPKNGAGIVHYRSIFDPRHFSFFWGKDAANRDVPYLSFKGQTYRIVNLHFHSKLPEGHTSYAKTRVNFP